MVQGGLDNPTNRTAFMATADALRTPAADAFQRAEAAQQATTAHEVVRDVPAATVAR